MASAISYSQMRLANLDENRRMLQELGVRMPSAGETVMINKPRAPPKRPKQRVSQKIPEPDGEDEDGEKKAEETPEQTGRSGRSFRFRIKPKNYQEYEDYIYEPPKPKLPRIKPENSYGSIAGVEVGREWDSRINCCYDLIHRPTVAGIHAGPDGAYSVALSGGYEDDVDFGESFTYTGEGGRDLKGSASNPKNLRTAPQSKDQLLERGNLALSRSVETQNPVRVVRGFKLDSDYAPDCGYRYDGLYQVKKYWAARGKSGFKVWKFAFVRCDPEPAPWTNMPLGSSFVPTSPSTPSSMPQTGVEACEAPLLDADDSKDHSQIDEANIGAKLPEERVGSKKKVSFNSEDSVRFYEPEREENPGRMATRSSSKTEVVGSEESEEEEMKPQVRERSKRTVKPTAKILENILQRSDGVSKSGEVPNQVDKKKNAAKKSDKDENTLEKSSNKENVSKSPKTDKSPSKRSDPKSKGSSPPVDKSMRRSPSLEKVPKEVSKKSPKGVDEMLKKSPKSSPSVQPRKRPVSPEYFPVEEMPSLSDENARKRLISPEKSAEESKKSLGSPPKKSTRTHNSLSENRRGKRTPSPEYNPPKDLEEFSKSSVKEKKQPRSPNSPTVKASKKHLNSSTSPRNSPNDKKQNQSQSSPNGSLKKSPKREQSPKSLKRSSLPSKQSPGTVSKSKSLKSPEEHKNHESPKALKSKKSVSPKTSPKSEKSRTKVSGTKSPSPKASSKAKKVSQRFPSPTTSSGEESGEEKRKIENDDGKFSDCDLSSEDIADAPTSPESAEEEAPAKRTRRCLRKTPLGIENGNGSISDGNTSSEDAVTSSESAEEVSPVERKRERPRKTPLGLENDGYISDGNSSSEDAPTSPESVKEGAPAKRKRGHPQKTPLPGEPVTKKWNKEEPDSEILTPPETETSNSNSSSPPSPVSSADSRCDTPSSEPDEFTEKTSDMSEDDDDEFPSDEEILKMMRFSVSSCSNDAPKITVRMVNGKWVEEEEPSIENTATNVSVETPRN